MRQGCACRNKAIVADAYRCYEVDVCPDKTVVADLRLVLNLAVIIAKHRAATYVCALPDGGIADIGQVRGLGAVPNR